MIKDLFYGRTPTVLEFSKFFSSDEVCLDVLFALKHRVCPRCGNDVSGAKRLTVNGKKKRCYQCSRCSLQIYPTAGTFFSKTTTPLSKVFFLAWTMASSKKNTSSLQVSKNMGISYKTAWRIMMALRLSIRQDEGPLSGVVEIDECFIGKGTSWGRWGEGASRKLPVLGMMERGGKLVLKAIESRTGPYLEGIIREHVLSGATVYTDGWKGYYGLKKYYDHHSVNHLKREYVRGDVHTNSIENFWGIFKRSVRHAHTSIRLKYVQPYCNEAAWRFNNRHLEPLDLFEDLLTMLLSSEYSAKRIHTVVPDPVEKKRRPRDQAGSFNGRTGILKPQDSVV